jgi:uncharacterized membrane protein YtjA (UPF0391 family)
MKEEKSGTSQTEIDKAKNRARKGFPTLHIQMVIFVCSAIVSGIFGFGSSGTGPVISRILFYISALMIIVCLVRGYFLERNR